MHQKYGTLKWSESIKDEFTQSEILISVPTYKIERLSGMLFAFIVQNNYHLHFISFNELYNLEYNDIYYDEFIPNVAFIQIQKILACKYGVYDERVNDYIKNNISSFKPKEESIFKNDLITTTWTVETYVNSIMVNKYQDITYSIDPCENQTPGGGGNGKPIIIWTPTTGPTTEPFDPPNDDWEIPGGTTITGIDGVTIPEPVEIQFEECAEYYTTVDVSYLMTLMSGVPIDPCNDDPIEDLTLENILNDLCSPNESYTNLENTFVGFNSVNIEDELIDLDEFVLAFHNELNISSSSQGQNITYLNSDTEICPDVFEETFVNDTYYTGIKDLPIQFTLPDGSSQFINIGNLYFNIETPSNCGVSADDLIADAINSAIDQLQELIDNNNTYDNGLLAMQFNLKVNQYLTNTLLPCVPTGGSIAWGAHMVSDAEIRDIQTTCGTVFGNFNTLYDSNCN